MARRMTQAERLGQIRTEGTTMGRINTFGASGEPQRADPSDETFINGAPYGGDQAIRGGAKTPHLPSTAPMGKLRMKSSVNRYR